MKQLTQKQVREIVFSQCLFKDAKIEFKNCTYNKDTKQFFIIPDNKEFIAWGTLESGLVAVNGHLGMTEVRELTTIENKFNGVIYEIR